MKIINVKLEDGLHREFKIKTTIEGTNMQDVVVKLIKEYLEKEDSK